MEMKFFSTLLISSALGLSACGGGGGGGSSSGSSSLAPTSPISSVPTTPSEPVTPAGLVTISGKVTFDSVPHDPLTKGLDYTQTAQMPARGISVEAVDDSGALLHKTVTNEQGQYSFNVDSNASVRILAKANMAQSGTAKWDVSVTDNTANNALYVLQSSLKSPGTSNQIRDLNAGSGWDGSAYSAPRAAGPFAILDPIYDGLQKLSAIDSGIDLPAMEFRWSVNNSAASGQLDEGDIVTSFYQDGNVYLLGNANGDTDEYDRHVVVHEWGHYIEDKLSRSDSIGGNHSASDRLDPRVAFGEGFGNALAGMILDDPIYRDSLGYNQAQGFTLDVESNAYANPGWFNEGSVQSLLYDIYDTDSDGIDRVSLGLGPIYSALTAQSYKDTDVFTSLFTFMDALKTARPDQVDNIDILLLSQGIIGTGPMGDGESNDGGVSSALPVFKSVTLGGPSVQVCSVDAAGRFNKLGNRDWVYFTVPRSGTYTINATRASGSLTSDPDFDIFQKGEIIISAKSGVKNSESWTGALDSGSYVIDAYDYNNLAFVTNNSGDSCFDLTLSQ